MVKVDKEVRDLLIKGNLISMKIMHDCLNMNQVTYSSFCMKYPVNRFDEYLNLIKAYKQFIDHLEQNINSFDFYSVQLILNNLVLIIDRVDEYDFYRQSMFVRALNNLRDMLYNMIQYRC